MLSKVKPLNEESKEKWRLTLLLIKQDFPHFTTNNIDQMSERQRRAYVGSVTRFLKNAKLFGYSKDEDNR